MSASLFFLKTKCPILYFLMCHIFGRALGYIFCFLFLQSVASAEVVFDESSGKAVQTVALNKGWNSVYLWVQPDTQDLTTYLAGKPEVTRVATFSQPVSRATMTESDSDDFQRNAGWKIWRSGSVLSKVNTLKGLLGARGYLFYASSETQLVFTGEFVEYDRYVNWVGDRFNFQSFPVISDSVSFGSYLAANSKLDQALVYELSDKAEWKLVDPRNLIDPEKAYWIYCHNGTDFTGNTLRADRQIILRPAIDSTGSTVYDAELELTNKIRDSVQISLSSALPLTAKAVRPGQSLNSADDPYQAISALNLELSDQTSNQINILLRLPSSAVPGQLIQAIEITTPQGDRKFYPLTIEGDL